MIISLLLATSSIGVATQEIHYVDLDIETYFPVTRKTLEKSVSEIDTPRFKEMVAVINRYVKDTKPKIVENRMRILFSYNTKLYAVDAEGNLAVGEKGGRLERPVRDHINRVLRRYSHEIVENK